MERFYPSLFLPPPRSRSRFSSSPLALTASLSHSVFLSRSLVSISLRFTPSSFVGKASNRCSRTFFRTLERKRRLFVFSIPDGVEFRQKKNNRRIIEKNSRVDPFGQFCSKFFSRIELRVLSFLNRNFQVDGSTPDAGILLTLFRDYDRIRSRHSRFLSRLFVFRIARSKG